MTVAAFKIASRDRVAMNMADFLALVEHVRGQMIHALAEVVSKLEAAVAVDAEVDTDFGALIKAAQHLLEMDDTEMARTFNVARPTVGRWIRGFSSPHPLMRKAICAALIKRARSKIKLLES